jgi:hypothetical protein
MHKFGMPRMKQNASKNAWAPSAVEENSQAVINSAAACEASITSTMVVRLARNDVTDQYLPGIAGIA